MDAHVHTLQVVAGGLSPMVMKELKDLRERSLSRRLPENNLWKLTGLLSSSGVIASAAQEKSDSLKLCEQISSHQSPPSTVHKPHISMYKKQFL